MIPNRGAMACVFEYFMTGFLVLEIAWLVEFELSSVQPVKQHNRGGPTGSMVSDRAFISRRPLGAGWEVRARVPRGV
jgi:hypothetical protein